MGALYSHSAQNPFECISEVFTYRGFPQIHKHFYRDLNVEKSPIKRNPRYRKGLPAWGGLSDLFVGLWDVGPALFL